METDKTTDPAVPRPVRSAFRVCTSVTGSMARSSRSPAARSKASLSPRVGASIFFPTGVQPVFCSAGRTDRGVHACGQVIAFSTSYPDRARQALNLQLPLDVWCTASAEVADAFHPRFDARSCTVQVLLFRAGARSAVNGSGGRDLHWRAQLLEPGPCGG